MSLLLTSDIFFQVGLLVGGLELRAASILIMCSTTELSTQPPILRSSFSIYLLVPGC